MVEPANDEQRGSPNTKRRGTEDDSQRPVVSAIVTTTGRPCTLEAITSALGQTLEEVEVIVVFDGPAEDCKLSLPEEHRLRLVATGSRSGEGAARTLGVEQARGRFVAFLDDDDRWLPEKLKVQTDLVAEYGRPGAAPLVSSRALVVDTGGHPQVILPARLIGDETVAEYLFRRRRIRFGESLLHPSTLLCDREVALRTAWRDMDIHADWDWLLRLTRTNDVQVLMAQQPLTHIVETPGSASRAGNWRGSLAWANEIHGTLSGRQWADLMLCVTALYAKDARRPLTALRIGYRAIRFGRPGVPALVFFSLYVLGPSRLLTRLVRLWARARLLSP